MSAPLQKITAPEWLRDNARRGLEWYEDGLGGDGLVAQTITDARAMASGFVSEEKAVRMAAWFARHMADIEGIDADETDPTPGMVAHALWGGWPRSESERAQAWAESNATNANAAAVTTDEKDGTHSTGETHMQFKTYNATLTTDAKAGTVEAVVSVFNNVDLVGDRMMPGAFSKSLEDYQATGRTIPFVWSHDYDTPESYIGKVIEARETSEGLHVKAELFDTPRAQVVRELLVNRVVSEFSFAYDIVDQQKAADGANELLQVKLLECGPTLRGANPMTRLIDAKAADVQAQKTDEPKPNLAALPDNYRTALSDDVPEGRACGNCAFYDETNLNEAGDKAFCTRWDDYADGGFYCNAWQARTDEEDTPEAEENSAPVKLQGSKAGRTLSSKNEASLSEACDLLKQAQDTLTAVLSSVQTSSTDEVKVEELPEMEAKAEEPTVADTSALLALLKLYALEN
jgi:HK97 family phage prohead protease